MTRFPFTLALAAAAAMTAASGAAAQQTEQRSTQIEYQDLDLSTEEGRAELQHRLDRAADSVCGANESNVGTYVRTRETRDCIRQAKRQLEKHFAEVLRSDRAGG